MNLLLVEPGASGHHMAGYTRFIARAAVARGWGVQLLTTASALSHPAFAYVNAEVPGGMKTFPMPEVPAPRDGRTVSLLRNQIRHFQAIKTGFRDRPGNQNEIAFIVTLDNCEKVISLLGSPFGSRRFGGMLVNPKFHRRRMGIGPSGRSDAVYERLFRRMLRSPSCACVTVVDESFHDFALQSANSEYAKLQLVPEIGEVAGNGSRSQARAFWGFEPDMFVILVYGGITARKGINSLLAGVDDANAKVAVLIAGTQYRDVQAELRSDAANRLRDQGRLIESNQFQDSEMEARAFAAADAVWLGYAPDFYGSSGVLFQAASAGLPVLASTHGLIGWLTRKHQLGLTFDPTNFGAVRDSVRFLIGNLDQRARFGENGSRLGKTHTAVEFGRAVCDALAKGSESGASIKVA